MNVNFGLYHLIIASLCRHLLARMLRVIPALISALSTPDSAVWMSQRIFASLTGSSENVPLKRSRAILRSAASTYGWCNPMP